MSSTEILTRFTLSFNDPDLLRIYKREKTDFFKRSLAIVSAMLGALAVGLQVGYSQLDIGLPNYISILNWSCLAVIVLITFFHSRCQVLHYLVCPLLTILAMMYISFVDYDLTLQSIYYSNIVGITISLFILIIFNESWIFSTIVYTPMISIYMYKTGFDLLGAEGSELIMRIIFCVIIYAIIGYRVETLTK